MTTMVRDETILKVHVAGTAVWTAAGTQAPLETATSVADFLDQVDWNRPVYVRALGTQSNAPLITALYPRCVRSGGRLEIASPMLCETREEQDNPEIALYRMRQCLLGPSMGGWHIFGPLDYPSYAIADQLLQNGGWYNEHCARLLETHPAWYDLTFIGSIQPAACATVLAAVRDPRWYVDYEHPERIARLVSYLGLHPNTQHVVSAGDFGAGVYSPRTTRCGLIRTAWGGLEQPRDVSAPEHFLWRRWRHHGGGPVGDLRAGQAFVSFLMRAWQHQICQRTGVQKIEMFLPEKLLTPGEMRAYQQHTLRRPNRV